MSHRCGATINNVPEKGGASPVCKDRIDPYHRASDTDSNEADPILSLRGLGKNVWINEEADNYVKRLREGWEGRRPRPPGTP